MRVPVFLLTHSDVFSLDLHYHPQLDKWKVAYWQRFLKIIKLFTYFNTDRKLLISFDY